MSSPTTLKILGGALAVQVVLAAFTWLPGSGTPPEPVKLVDLDRDAITEITILGSADDEDPLVLTKEDGAWAVTSLGGFPAKADKVAEVLDTLDGLEAARPIATRATSHPSLSVADDDFGRKVIVSDGTSERTILLGAASGKAVNVRLADSDDVYVVRGVSLWSIADSPRSYYDTQIQSLDEDTIQSLTVDNPRGAFTIARDDTGWTLLDAPEGTAVDTAAVDRLLSKVATVRMIEPVGTDDRPEYGLADGARVEWVLAVDGASETGGMTIGAKDGTARYLRVDGQPFVVKVSDGLYASVLEMSADDLIASTE